MSTSAAWPARLPLFCGFATTALLVLGIGLWGGTTTLAGAIIAPGRVEVAQDRQVVEHIDGGTVARIAVAEGAAVQAGDVLIELDGTNLQSQLLATENELYEIIARRARLEAERDDAQAISFPAELLDEGRRRSEIGDLTEGQERLFDARRETLRQQSSQLGKQVEQIESQITGITAQMEAQRRQVELLQRELTDQQALFAKGLARADRVLALEREQARIEGVLGELLASRAQAEGRITEIQLELTRTLAKRREDASTELRDVAYRELALTEKRRTLHEQIARLNITAPVSGVVLGLQATTPRSVIRPAEPILYLIPQDRPLVVSAQIPTSRVDQLFVGQPVRVKFSGIVGPRPVEITGEVRLISADAVSEGAGQPPFYEVRIEFDAEALRALSEEEIIPGMPVEAYFRTEDRTPLNYLLKPFTDYFSRAFRET